MPGPVRILLRSSWQTVNIGDVAHSPGVLLSFQEFAPDAELILWPYELDDREREMFARELPQVRVVDGAFDDAGEPTTPELAEAWATSDLLVHGSGPNPMRHAEIDAWAGTGRPYGYFGITVEPFVPPQPNTLLEQAVMIDSLPADYLEPALRRRLDGAAFVYCRDSLSLRYLRGQGIRASVLDLGPDGTLAYQGGDDVRALLAELELTPGRYLCLIPRLRWTPYHLFKRAPATQEAYRRDAVNALHTASDMVPLREAAIAWVRRTGGQVLICSEMSYQVEVGREHLSSGYPPDVQPHVRHLSRYWELPEAAAVYREAAAVLSIDCHSPLIATTGGTPAMYLRQPTDTVKGQMYRDLGLPYAEIERDGAAAAVTWVRGVADDAAAAAEVSAAAAMRARDLLAEMVRTALAAARA